MSRVSRHPQETFIFACGIVEKLSVAPTVRVSERRNPKMR